MNRTKNDHTHLHDRQEHLDLTGLTAAQIADLRDVAHATSRRLLPELAGPDKVHLSTLAHLARARLANQ